MDASLTVRIPEELKNALKELSKSENRSVSDFVRDSLEKTLAVKRFRGVREKTLPFAEAAGFLTDDDVFESLR